MFDINPLQDLDWSTFEVQPVSIDLSTFDFAGGDAAFTFPDGDTEAWPGDPLGGDDAGTGDDAGAGGALGPDPDPATLPPEPDAMDLGFSQPDDVGLHMPAPGEWLL